MVNMRRDGSIHYRELWTTNRHACKFASTCTIYVHVLRVYVGAYMHIHYTNRFAEGQTCRTDNIQKLLRSECSNNHRGTIKIDTRVLQ